MPFDGRFAGADEGFEAWFSPIGSGVASSDNYNYTDDN